MKVSKAILSLIVSVSAAVSLAQEIRHPPSQSSVSSVVVTITGTVSYGLDQTGVFGPAQTDLTGRSFTLVLTYDNKGQQSTQNCSGVPCTSMVSGSGSSSPGTALLTIGSGSFKFGTFDGGAYASSM